MSVSQRWSLGVMAVSVVALLVFFVWYMQAPQEVLEGTLVYEMGVNRYV